MFEHVLDAVFVTTSSGTMTPYGKLKVDLMNEVIFGREK
jgi:hypothetical protein